MRHKASVLVAATMAAATVATLGGAARADELDHNLNVQDIAPIQFLDDTTVQVNLEPVLVAQIPDLKFAPASTGLAAINPARSRKGAFAATINLLPIPFIGRAMTVPGTLSYLTKGFPLGAAYRTATYEQEANRAALEATNPRLSNSMQSAATLVGLIKLSPLAIADTAKNWRQNLTDLGESYTPSTAETDEARIKYVASREALLDYMQKKYGRKNAPKP